MQGCGLTQNVACRLVRGLEGKAPEGFREVSANVGPGRFFAPSEEDHPDERKALAVGSSPEGL